MATIIAIMAELSATKARLRSKAEQARPSHFRAAGDAIAHSR